MFLMKNQVRPYAWGSRTAISGLLGGPVPSNEPQAELWVGAHPGDSSVLVRPGDERPLLHAVADDPNGTLGPQVAREFDDSFPFLLKLLAADAPLSLQAHPTMDQARAGFDAENTAGVPVDAPFRNYKDRSHKPELMYALTEFEALCGFRPTVTTVRLLDELGTPVLGDVRSALVEQPGEPGLREVVTSLLEADRAAIAPTVDSVAAACRARAGSGGEFAREYAMAARLADHYPGDPGVLIALLMNRIELAPGEAVYLPAGNMHAYLSGFGVEIMASSDNVLRGGLTTKHVDVAELSAVVSFAPGDPMLVTGVPVAPGEVAFRTPAPEFALSRVRVDEVGRVLEHTGPQILLVTEGTLTLTDAQGNDLSVGPGRSVFLPARQGPVRVHGAGTLFRATDGLLERDAVSSTAPIEPAAPAEVALSLAS
ncbi:mannose-6-phosphate isomerase, class I [Nakamurella sp.]|uniref:mannose-6-phosphate isomerase, class I n=1 Tax=Nakamurella sp. TaxID=1869182 RepID=UPI003783F745